MMIHVEGLRKCIEEEQGLHNKFMRDIHMESREAIFDTFSEISQSPLNNKDHFLISNQMKSNVRLLRKWTMWKWKV